MADISSIKVTRGDTFGHWTVTDVHTAQKVECICICGYKKEQRQTDLLRGVTKQCPGCYAKKPKAGIHTGKKFGKWTVVNVEDFTYLHRKNGNVLERQYKCRCVCGTEKYVRTSHITRGLSKQCDKCRLESYYVTKVGCIPMSDIIRYKRSATQRHKEWKVSPEYLYELYENQNRICALSGMKIDFSEKGTGTPGAKDTSTASLDRIDSKQGYIEGNVQWVHKDVNKMKMELPQERFLEMVKQISKYKQL
jgi:hypothetical protein